MGINSHSGDRLGHPNVICYHLCKRKPVVNPVEPTYFLHALDLVSLKDKVSPLKVAASHTQTNGAAFTFDATYQRQRAALLFANGKVYAAFTSFCDLAAVQRTLSRGWLLGWSWNGTTLTALPANQLNDRQPGSPSTLHFLGHNLDVRRWPRE